MEYFALSLVIIGILFCYGIAIKYRFDHEEEVDVAEVKE